MPSSLTMFEKTLRHELSHVREQVLSTYGDHDCGSQKSVKLALNEVNYSDWPEYLAKLFMVKHEPLLQRLIELEAAVAQFEIGQYGYCADCEERIELTLLEQDPATQRCRHCQEVNDHVKEKS